MLSLIENPNANHVRELASFLGADFQEDSGTSILYANNEKAKGKIISFQVFKGLSVWVYDIKFLTDFKVELLQSAENLHYFSYNLKGHFQHRFANEASSYTVEQHQNMIVIGAHKNGVEIVFPEDISLQLSVIIINPNLLEVSTNKHATKLKASLIDLFGKIGSASANRFISTIQAEAARYADIIVKNQREDIIGALLVEGAVMSLLAMQIAGYKANFEKDAKVNLTSSELDQIAGLGDLILANPEKKMTISYLQKHFGFSPAKIQAGTKHLFGQSVAQFIISTKLRHAKNLLRTTELNISEISYSVGISSLSYFSKIFKEKYGVLPSGYKDSFHEKYPLFSLCYSSVMKVPSYGKTLKHIVRKARIFNDANGITGCLAHSSGTVLQILEGRKKVVLNLFKKIRADERHHNVELLWKDNIASRNFENWSMALLSDEFDLNNAKVQLSPKIGMDKLLEQLEKSVANSDSMFKQVEKIIVSRQHITRSKRTG